MIHQLELWDNSPLHGRPVTVVICQGAIPLSVINYENVTALLNDEELLDPVLQGLSERGLEPSKSVIDDMEAMSDADADCFNFYIFVPATTD